jgi:hypothetical protein
MARPRTLSVALIGFALALCAGANADGLPARNQRHRVGRSLRVAAEHSNDACHEGETQSLDAHFGRHAYLDIRNESRGDGEPFTGHASAGLPVRPPAIVPPAEAEVLAFPPASAAPAPPFRGGVRGRAPPSSSR